MRRGDKRRLINPSSRARSQLQGSFFEEEPAALGSSGIVTGLDRVPWATDCFTRLAVGQMTPLSYRDRQDGEEEGRARVPEGSQRVHAARTHTHPSIQRDAHEGTLRKAGFAGKALVLEGLDTAHELLHARRNYDIHERSAALVASCRPTLHGWN